MRPKNQKYIIPCRIQKCPPHQFDDDYINGSGIMYRSARTKFKVSRFPSEENLDNLTYRAFLVFPLALLQPGASYRYYTWLGLVPALSTIFVTPYRIAIAECEASSKYSEILYGIIYNTDIRLEVKRVQCDKPTGLMRCGANSAGLLRKGRGYCLLVPESPSHVVQYQFPDSRQANQ